MPVYTARAILHNDMDVWAGAFERLGREGHSFVNAPATRIGIETGSFAGSRSEEIAAGLGFGLSCILPLVRQSGGVVD